MWVKYMTLKKKIKPIDEVRHIASQLGKQAIDQIAAEASNFIKNWDFSNAKRKKFLKRIGEILFYISLSAISAMMGVIFG